MTEICELGKGIDFALAAARDVTRGSSAEVNHNIMIGPSGCHCHGKLMEICPDFIAMGFGGVVFGTEELASMKVTFQKSNFGAVLRRASL